MAEFAPVVSLPGRRVLVTGGARGLGAAFVKALVAA
ncbi:MAG: short-chain dehydrogenase, partial [Burkholderia sp.]|nr:short-chain dehydrogenase [Burkholderia sp.]